MSYTFLVSGLVLQGGGLRIVFSCIYPIISIICLKIHALPCKVLASGLLLLLPLTVLLHVVLLNSILAK